MLIRLGNRHIRSFFGQKCGLILDSSEIDQENVYMTFIKKLSNGSWEKPSERQGKKIKMNLGELIMIQKVLTGISDKWSTVHRFKNDQTSISISKDKNNINQFWINVGSYNKNIRSPELEIMQLLLNHIIQEKVEFATCPTESLQKNEEGTSKESKTKNNEEEISVITGEFKDETGRAALIYFEQDNKEIWIPKSTIKSEIVSTPNPQEFRIKKWILEKYGLAVV